MLFCLARGFRSEQTAAVTSMMFVARLCRYLVRYRARVHAERAASSVCGLVNSKGNPASYRASASTTDVLASHSTMRGVSSGFDSR